MRCLTQSRYLSGFAALFLLELGLLPDRHQLFDGILGVCLTDCLKIFFHAISLELKAHLTIDVSIELVNQFSVISSQAV